MAFRPRLATGLALIIFQERSHTACHDVFKRKNKKARHEIFLRSGLSGTGSGQQSTQMNSKQQI